MAEWHVNGAAASSGDGTSEATAFRTIGEAVSAMSGGDTVNVAGGVYRESVSLSGKSGTSANPTRLLGDPLDPFIISGGEPLTGLVPCVAGDAVHVGANWASMRKTAVPASLFPDGDPLAGNLCEDGVQMPICVERADISDTFFLTKPTYYHKADTFTQSGGNITGFRKPSVTDGYTKAQIENAECYFVHGLEPSGNSPVTFDEGTKTVSLVNPETYAGSGNPLADHFALFNLLPAMKPGEWGFRRVGSDVVIYVRTAGAVGVFGSAPTAWI